MNDLWALLEPLLRRSRVLRAIFAVIIVGGCAYTFASKTINIFSLLPTAVALLLLLAGGWLGSHVGSRVRAVSARLGFNAPALDVITVMGAILTGAASAVVVDIILFIGGMM